MKTILKLAAIYNILWGTWVILFPNHFFELVAMPPLNMPFIWQGLGMVVGLYGFGYWIASYYPLKHWPIVLIGFLGKVLGPVGFLGHYLEGNVSISFFYINIFNDVIWWIPFGYILYKVHQKTRWKLN